MNNYILLYLVLFKLGIFLYTGNVDLIVGLAVGIPMFCCCFGIPILAICIGMCCTNFNKRRTAVNTRIVTTSAPRPGSTIVTTAQTNTTSFNSFPAAPYPVEHYPTEFKSALMEAPPPYPGTSDYPVHHQVVASPVYMYYFNLG